MAAKELKAVTLGVSSVSDTKKQLATAIRGERVGEFLGFASVELLWKVLTSKRWDILKAMAGQGELSIREVARRVRRDVKSVHGDVHALILAGILERADGGGVIFPYDAVRVNFTLRAAA